MLLWIALVEYDNTMVPAGNTVPPTVVSVSTMLIACTLYGGVPTVGAASWMPLSSSMK